MLTDVGIAEIAKGVTDLKNLNTIALNLHGYILLLNKILSFI